MHQNMSDYTIRMLDISSIDAFNLSYLVERKREHGLDTSFEEKLIIRHANMQLEILSMHAQAEQYDRDVAAQDRANDIN